MKHMNNRWLQSQPYRHAATDGDEGSSGGEGGDDDGGGDSGSIDADSTGSTDDSDTDSNDADAGSGGDDGGSTDPFYSSLPDDWRNQLAGENEARLNDLSRYTSLDKFIESAFEAKDKIRKGEVSTGLPEDADDEKIAAYREANGIPADPTDYKVELQDGLELTDMDMEVMEGVQKIAHEYNISNEALSAITNMQLQGREAQIEAMDAQDGIDKMEAEKLLKENWKGEYDQNMGATIGLLARLPEDVRDEILMGRTASGKGLMNTPEFVQLLADVAVELNPGYTLPGGGDNMYAAADDVINKVKKIFAEGRESEDYYKDAELQKQYEKALDIKARSKQ